jgi:[CysO sulfur-carrier protein]-S-L-cysteine hydrolase
MIQQAQAELPNECCGLLAGVRDGDVLRVLACFPLVNEAASPVEYWSEPKSLFATEKEMRRLGYERVAVYHSHPTSEPIPSKTDLERCVYNTDVVHFIISLKGAEPLMRGWWLTETSFAEAAWQLVDG